MFVHSICSDGASLQERLLRLPFYSDCWPEIARRERERRGEATASTSLCNNGAAYQYLQEQDSSRNRSEINLNGLMVGGGGITSKNVPENELPLGVFLYKNYR